MAYSSVGHGRRAADAGARSTHGRRGPSFHPARPPETGLCCVRATRRPGPPRAGQGRAAGRWGRVPGMFAHSTQNQNWWWTASPAAR
ncbi:trp operon leader peptide [Streptomyces sp. NPDC006700]|uniref:trp operon leader peptide n=1 Tax=unclassified Streptomyces TaxID=2593676 RepID=UPI0033CA94E1